MTAALTPQDFRLLLFPTLRAVERLLSAQATRGSDASRALSLSPEDLMFLIGSVPATELPAGTPQIVRSVVFLRCIAGFAADPTR